MFVVEGVNMGLGCRFQTCLGSQGMLFRSDIITIRSAVAVCRQVLLCGLIGFHVPAHSLKPFHLVYLVYIHMCRCIKTLKVAGSTLKALLIP